MLQNWAEMRNSLKVMDSSQRCESPPTVQCLFQTLDKQLLETLTQLATGNLRTKMLWMSSVKRTELSLEDPSGPLIDKPIALPEATIRVSSLMPLVKTETDQEIFYQLEPMSKATRRMN